MSSFFSKIVSSKSNYTIGFYNVENLFDTYNNPLILDDDFTPKGKKSWSNAKYQNKLRKLAKVISQLGRNNSFLPPILMGLCEVENKKVIIDLINTSSLKKYDYGFVHYDSSDERGIDVALIYNKKVFELLESKSIPLKINNTNGKRDFTRDVLLVKGFINKQLIYVFINHWPSRKDGAKGTEYKRIEAANLLRKEIDIIQNNDAEANIIIMGDFNDNPIDTSIKKNLLKQDFFNPMESLFLAGKGSVAYKNKWDLFDQILFTKNFYRKEQDKLTFIKVGIYKPSILKIYKGKYKGNPFRTFVGQKYQGGVSDHFPVYAILRKGV